MPVPPTRHLTTAKDRSFAALREIEQEEDARQATEIQIARLQQLRELHQAALRRHGLGHFASVKPGDSPLPGIIVEESGYWLVESE